MLFKTTPELRMYAQLNTDINFASIKATIQSSEDKQIIPVIGRALYDDLNDQYNNDATEAELTEEYKKLLDACRKVVGPLTAYYYATKTDVSVSDSGVRRMETNTSKTAYQYQLTNYRQACLQEAETAIENLIGFLEANKTDYTAWTESAEYIEYQKLFIKTATDFNIQFPSFSPFRNYWAMRGKMFDVEEMGIRGFLGDDLFDAFKEKDRAGGFTDDDEKLMSYLKKMIANNTVAAALPILNVRISENGLTVSTISPRSNNEDISTRSGADHNSIDTVCKSCAAAAESWQKLAENFLRKNADAYATWPGNIKKCEHEKLNNSRRGSFGLG